MTVDELWGGPVLVAPMGGGPTTTELVVAAAEAGSFAFIAAAYRSTEWLRSEIERVQRRVRRFGVNVFVPGQPTADVAAVARYVETLRPDAARLRVDLGTPRWDDDEWSNKLDLLLEMAPPMCSFAFGCPEGDVVDALHRRGVAVMVTVTNIDEAGAAVDAGADVVCAQGIEAGAHRGTFDDAAADDELPMLDLVRALTSSLDVPVVAAGGITTPLDVHAALGAGAVAAQCGTAFLRCEEAGTSEVHRAALVDPTFTGTALTRSFTGRRARGLVNEFMIEHPDAPSAFPEIHHATRPLRTAAARAADADALNLWAGVGHREARAAPAAQILGWLTSGASVP